MWLWASTCTYPLDTEQPEVLPSDYIYDHHHGRYLHPPRRIPPSTRSFLEAEGALTTADFQIWKLRPFEFDSPRARRAGHDCRIRFDRARRAAADPENYPVESNPLESNLHGELARTHGSRAGI